jgi:hypothetical protein
MPEFFILGLKFICNMEESVNKINKTWVNCYLNFFSYLYIQNISVYQILDPLFLEIHSFFLKTETLTLILVCFFAITNYFVSYTHKRHRTLKYQYFSLRFLKSKHYEILKYVIQTVGKKVK